MSKRLHRRSAKILRRRERLPLLSAALFGSSKAAYTRRRLLFPAGRTAMMAFFHALEAAALLLIFDPAFLIPIISLRLGSSLASAAIWGATEPLRQDLRALPRSEEHHARPRRIEEALSRASLFSMILVLFGVFWVWRYPYLVRGFFSVIDAYLLALVFRIALSWVSRTYHSGLLANRRVYRPRWSMIVPDIFDGLGLFIFWRLVGPWSIAIAVVGSTSFHVALAYIYSKRGYRDAGMVPPRLFRFKRLALPSWSLVGRWFLSLAIGVSCELPSIYVLGQWHSLAGGADVSAAMLLYWARPFASFLSSIPRIYYVDLVRAEELGSIGSQRLRKGITHTILLWGTVLTIGCTATALTFFRGNGAIGLGLYLFASTILAVLTLRALHFMIFGYCPPKAMEQPTLLEFLEGTTKLEAPCTAVLFQLAVGQPARVAHALVAAAERLRGVAACRLGRRHLLCVSTTLHKDEDWLGAAAGTATLVASAPWSRDGKEALASLYHAQSFPPALKTMLRGTETLEALQNSVLEKTEGTLLFTASNGVRTKDKLGSLGDLRHAIRQFQGAFPPPAIHWGSAGTLLLVVHQGRCQWLSLIPQDTPSGLSAALRREAWSLGIRAAWFGRESLKPEALRTTLAIEKGA